MKEYLPKNEAYCKYKMYANDFENAVHKEKKVANFALATVIDELYMLSDDNLHYSMGKCINMARNDAIVYSHDNQDEYEPSKTIFIAFHRFQFQKSLLMKEPDYRNYLATKTICKAQTYNLRKYHIYAGGIISQISQKYGLTPNTLNKFNQWFTQR